MTPDERAARLHLTAAAESLRVASERLCDWLEATGQDVAGNGHVASADEATGSLREAPTAPVSSSLPPIPLGAVVEALDFHWEWQEKGTWAAGEITATNGGTLDVLLTALYRARRELAEKEQQMADALAPFGCEFLDPPDGGDVPFGVQIARMGSALVEARRALAARESAPMTACHTVSIPENIAVEVLDEIDAAVAAGRAMGHGAWAILNRVFRLLHPHLRADAGRFELHTKASAERQSSARLNDSVVSENAPLSGAGNMADSGNQAPAPASAPRRWWLVVDCDGTPREAYEWDERHIADKAAAAYNRSDDTFAPFAVVPVVEARVTRETVERVEGIVRKARGTNRTSEHWAYEIVRALGLTVEA